MNFVKTFGDCSGPLDFPMSTDDARELEKRLDSGEWSPIRIQKSDSFESVLIGERSDISVINDGSIDRDGEIVDPNSISFKKFQNNPLVTWNHNYEIPPLGKSLWQKLCTGSVWKAKTQYANRPDTLPKDSAWFPDAVFHLVKSGMLNAKSVGGAVNWREITKEDIEKHPEYSTAKRISSSVEVWEYAVCPIGANSGTIVEQVSKGLIKLSDEDIEKAFPEIAEAIKDLGINNIGKDAPPFPVIKSFTTVEDYNKQQEQLYNEKVDKLKNSIPQLVEDSFKRALGQVS